MTKKDVKIEARQSILAGNTKQQTFDKLKTTGKLPAEELAEIIRPIPTLQARQKYKQLQIILLVLLFLTVLVKVLAVMPIITEDGIQWSPEIIMLSIVCIFYVILFWAVAMYRPGSHKIAAVVTILSLYYTLGYVMNQGFLFFADLAIAAGIIGLGFYLNSRFSSSIHSFKEKYQNDQGQDRLRNVITFDD